jgi:RNA polymerase sigma-70 factor, ECF subfamily
MLADAAGASPARPEATLSRARRPAGDVASVDRLAGLIKRSAQGDPEAFAEVYRLFHAKIYRLARFHLGAQAEDAVSETFLRAWVAIPAYRKTGAPFAAWLYGIARHVVSDLRAARRREEPRPQLPDEALDADPSDRLALRREIDRLPPIQRYVIEAKFLVGVSNGELAAALGKTVGAVNAIQWRALRTLSTRLEDR